MRLFAVGTKTLVAIETLEEVGVFLATLTGAVLIADSLIEPFDVAQVEVEKPHDGDVVGKSVDTTGRNVM